MFVDSRGLLILTAETRTTIATNLGLRSEWVVYIDMALALSESQLHNSRCVTRCGILSVLSYLVSCRYFDIFLYLAS